MSGLCLLAEVLDKETGDIMEFNSVFNGVLVGGLIGVAPYLAGWIATIILMVILLRRGGGRAERFVIAGASLKLLSNLLNIPAAAIVPWLVQRGATITYASSAVLIYQIGRGVVNMAGVICLVYAFWVKFRSGK